MTAALLLLVWLSLLQMSVLGRASVTITPSTSQFFEYDQISVSCGRSSGAWTVWRSTAGSMSLTPCGSGWGHHSSSGCVLKTAKLTDSGVYWCQSHRGQSSHAVHVLVLGGPVILRTPVLPVTEGQDVRLSCRSRTTSDLPADFYRDDSPLGRAPSGHMTLRRVSKSDEAVYTCHIGADVSPPGQLLVTDGDDVASLTASPDSSQLFEYENLTLRCSNNNNNNHNNNNNNGGGSGSGGGSGGGGGWSVIRFTMSDGKMSACGGAWGTLAGGGCVLHTVKLPDGATYWCQSVAQQRSDAARITVYDRPVLLKTPVLPVAEGQDVTLSCRTRTGTETGTETRTGTETGTGTGTRTGTGTETGTRTRTTSDLPADFYKDGSFVRTEPTGHMTFHSVGRADEGLYRCNTSHGESPPGWLSVTDSRGSALPAAGSALSALGVMRRLLVFSPYCVSTVIVVSLYQHRPSGRKRPVSTTMAPPSEEDERLDRPDGDVIDNVTTRFLSG